MLYSKRIHILNEKILELQNSFKIKKILWFQLKQNVKGKEKLKEDNMKLTSKGRAAVTSLVDMSLNINDGNPVKLSDISNRQNISVNFLEQIFLL